MTPTTLALLFFIGGAGPAAFLTWAACTLHRDRYYIRRIPKTDLQPRYSRKEKQDGVV